METFLDTIWQEVLIALVVAGVLGALGLIRNSMKSRSNETQVLKDETVRLRKLNWRNTKALIILAKLIDEQTETYHDGSRSELEEIIKEIISDNST